MQEVSEPHPHWTPGCTVGARTLCVLVLSRFSRVSPFVTPWAAARQAPLSMGFSRQEYWSELPFPSPGDLPDPGIELGSPALQAGSLPLSHIFCLF